MLHQNQARLSNAVNTVASDELAVSKPWPLAAQQRAGGDQVTTEKSSGITNDPNRTDDPEYIVRLIGQVVYVSLETVKIVKGLPEFVIETGEAAKA